MRPRTTLTLVALLAAACGDSSRAQPPATQPSTSSAVVPGKGDWLFWKERREVYAAESDLPVKNARVIIDFRDQLKAMGVELVVVTVPDQVYAAREQWADAKAEWKRGHFDAAVKAMREKGVTVVEGVGVVEGLRGKGVKVALTQDAHLTPPAYEALAKAAAGVVQKVAPVAGRAGDFSVVEGNYLEPSVTADAAKVPPARVSMVIRRVKHASGEPMVASRPGAAVLIMGDSNVIEYCPEGGSFADHLAMALGVVPDVHSRAGDKSGDALRIDLARQEGGLAGTKVVVWAFLEGSMVLHGEWKKVPLRRPSN